MAVRSQVLEARLLRLHINLMEKHGTLTTISGVIMQNMGKTRFYYLVEIDEAAFLLV